MTEYKRVGDLWSRLFFRYPRNVVPAEAGTQACMLSDYV
jgi:hypothetical protein